MMIKVENLLNIVAKVSTAVGDNDLLKISFLVQKGHNLCQLVAYDGTSLQFQTRFVYEGDAEQDGSYIVKASSLIKTLVLYKELGVDSITIEPGETSIVIKDGKGSTTLPILDKMVTLSEENVNEDAKGMFAMPLKALQDVLKVSNIAIAKETKPSLNGVYFHLSEAKEYTIYASDGYVGTRGTVTADITLHEGGSTEGMSFSAMPTIVKAVGSLKGDALCGIVTGKYLLLKDQENTLAVVALNRTAYPLDLMRRTFTKKDEAGEGEVYSRVTLSAAKLVAVTELCALSGTEKDKIVKIDYSDDKFKVSESADKSERSLDDAAVKVENTAVLSKRYMVDIIRKALRAVATEKVTVKFTNCADLLYADGAVYPVAFMLPRKDG